MQKLEEAFKANGGEWREVAILNLFEKIVTKKLPYKAGDLKGKHDDVYSLPALTAGIENQGLAYYVPRKNATILKNCISVSANGANTGAMFYQSQEFTVLQDSYAIKYKGKELSYLEYLYFLGLLQKAIRGSGKFDYSNKAIWERIKTRKISVPYKNNEIAFSYMEAYIKALEAERIETLEAYLIVTGLSDTNLSSDERKALESIASDSHKNDTIGGVIEWREYKIGELFEVNSSKKIYHANAIHVIDSKISNTYPYVSRSGKNNGVKGYLKECKNNLNPASTLSFAQDTFCVFYQEQPYFTGNKVKVLMPKMQYWNKKIGFYLCTACNYSLVHYTWGVGSTVDSIREIAISLPTKNGEIAFDFMEHVISATQKIVIKDVIDWKDKKIKATKEVVARS